MRHLRSPWGQAALGLVVYLAVSLTLYARFGTSYDLAIFHQGLSNAAHGRTPTVALKGVGANLFGDHFHPVVLVAVPFLAVHDSPATLLVVQSMSLALAAWMLARTWRRVHGERWWYLPLLWSLGPGAMAAAAYDVHELALGAPLLALACAAFVVRRDWAVVAWGLALPVVKEDAFVLSLGLGAALLLRRRWLPGAVLVVVPLAWAAAVIGWVIPALNAHHSYTYLGGPSATLGTRLAVLALALVTGALLLAASAGRALGSPLVLVAAAWWGSHALLANSHYQVPWYHYHVLPALALAFAAVEPWGRHPLRGRALRLLVAGNLALALLGPATWRLVLTATTRPDAAAAAVAAVDPGSTAAADPALAARTSARSRLVALVGPPRLTDVTGAPVRPDYVLLDERARGRGGDWLATWSAANLTGYELVLARDGYRVYRRAS